MLVLFVAVAPFIFLHPVIAQILPLHTYTIKDGLPSNEIRVLCQDSRDFLWIGTTQGISIYDGNAFTNYNENNGLALNIVNDIIEDRTSPGTMWVATNGKGIDRVENGKFTNFHFQSTEGRGGRKFLQGPEFVNKLMQDHEGMLWCGSDNGIFQIKNGVVRDFHSEKLLGGIFGIVEAGDSTVWIASNSGLYHYYPWSDTLVYFNVGEPESTVDRICLGAKGTLWAATFLGNVLEIKNGQILHRCSTELKRTPQYNMFFSLIDDGQENLWACTHAGLLKISKERLQQNSIITYTTDNGLPENTISSFLIDREKNIWVGSESKGLIKLTDQTAVKFPLQNFVPGPNPMGARIDSAGHLWVLEKTGVVEIWLDEQVVWRRVQHPVSGMKANEQLICVTLDHRDRIWITSSSHRYVCFEIAHRKGSSSLLTLIEDLRLPDLRHNATIFAFIIDTKGRIWESVAEQGILLLDPDKSPPLLRRISAKEWPPVISVRALCEDHLGNIWLGGFDGGLAKISGDQSEENPLQVFTTADGLPDNRIRSIIEDNVGRLFIGTRLGGLAIREKETFRTLTVNDGLLSNTVWCMATDIRGKVWLGSDLGVQSFDPEINGDFWADKEFYGSPIGYCGVYKDLYVSQITPGELIIYKYPKKDRAHIPRPPVYITNFTVNSTGYFFDELREFNYDQNNVLIDFVGISFKDERFNRYQYRLFDNDIGWQPLTKQTSVTYAALTPGRYRFEVRAINSDGIESLQPAAITFAILSPFWQRWWFYALVGISLVGLTIIIYRYRVNQLLNIERMRTRIATDLHDDIGASLTRIALFSEVAKEEAANSSPRLLEMAEKIGTNARELLDAVGTLVWSIDPRHDRFEDVLTHLKNFAQEMLSMKGIEYTFNVQEEVSRLQLPLDARKNVLLIFKEAINNIVKHSGAKSVSVSLAMKSRMLEMRIVDDGRGIASTILRPGHGLMNMRTRAQNIRGTLDIQAEKAQGTVILLRLPITE